MIYEGDRVGKGDCKHQRDMEEMNLWTGQPTMQIMFVCVIACNHLNSLYLWIPVDSWIHIYGFNSHISMDSSGH